MDIAQRGEWLQARKRILGGTDVAAILGKSGYADSTAYNVWADKTGRYRKHLESPEIERGNRLERPLAEWWADVNKYQLYPGELLIGPEGWNGGTPDFIATRLGAVEPPIVWELLEIKTANANWFRGVPEAYEIQVRWYLGLLNELERFGPVELAHVVALADMEFVHFKIWHDPEWYEQVKDFARDWWFRHVVADVPPDVAAGDEHTVTKVFDRPDGSVIELDPELYSVLETWEVADMQEAIYKAQGAKAKAQVKAALGNAETGTIDGRTVVTWRPDKNGKRTLRRK